MRNGFAMFIWLLIFAAVVTLVISVAFTDDANAQVYRTPAVTKVETKCEICGRSIYQEKAVSEGSIYLGEFSTMSPDFGGFIPDSERVAAIDFEFHATVCQQCKERYGPMMGEAFADVIKVNWQGFINQRENVRSREANEDQRQKARIQDLNKQVEELRAKVKRLKEGKPEEDPPQLRFKSSASDSVWIKS